MNTGESLLDLFAAIAALAAAGLLVALRQSFKDRLAQVLKKMLHGEHQISAGDVRQGRWMLNALVELRLLTGGDRAFVAQFHNGTVFSANNPVWRITRTHEIVRPGFAFIASHRRSVQVTQWLDIVAPLFNEKVSGVRLLCAASDASCDVPVFELRMDDLPDSHAKAAIRMAGTSLGLMSPLYKKNSVIGYVGVEFCARIDGCPAIPGASALQMARSVKVINYLLLRAKEI